MAKLAKVAASAIRTAIKLAGGREVCFACTIDAAGTIQTARVVARGDAECVLALPGFAKRGELLLHNHPSGDLTPSDPDLAVAARLHDDGIGFAIVDNAATQLYVVVEVPQPATETRLDLKVIDSELGPAGPIARALEQY